uniref:Response regulatory domain-containing protein n=1 Tax=Thermosporothrix sp. COM3 TaxID=2490863 RepID=A0A455SX70_9CHLR|nr:hypothetical protein KTC_54360 [Thermosporothrix sp. COM3]
MNTIVTPLTVDTETSEKVVLVVEDDADLRETIQWMLEDEGIAVETAADGREALERALQSKPALVLLDIGLPVIDGHGVAAGLHSAYGDSIAILTMTAGGHAAEKAERMGAIGYLSKPFDLDVLIHSVRSALQMSS